MKRCFAVLVIFSMLFAVPAQAAPIQWVDFSVPYESLEYAMNADIESYEKEKHLGWIEILSVAACSLSTKHCSSSYSLSLLLLGA